jgi:molybdopterin converting factor small subunit
MVIIKIPSIWRQACEDLSVIAAPNGSLSQVLNNLVEQYPSLKSYLYTTTGDINPVINLFINQEHIRYRGGMQAPVEDGDEIYIVPPISGGSLRVMPENYFEDSDADEP